MNIVSAIVIYVVVWWVILFTILPLWVQPVLKSEKYADTAAPRRSYIKKKFLLTTIISFFIWAIICGLIIADIQWLNDLYMKTE